MNMELQWPARVAILLTVFSGQIWDSLASGISCAPDYNCTLEVFYKTQNDVPCNSLLSKTIDISKPPNIRFQAGTAVTGDSIYLVVMGDPDVHEACNTLNWYFIWMTTAKFDVSTKALKFETSKVDYSINPLDPVMQKSRYCHRYQIAVFRASLSKIEAKANFFSTVSGSRGPTYKESDLISQLELQGKVASYQFYVDMGPGPISPSTPYTLGVKSKSVDFHSAARSSATIVYCILLSLIFD